ncbi:DUF3592 domain-containing protein [Streptomyces sp. NPDC048291]|uniref:DUF3592 domain-containing protein n=1 Tax=Streptomyces sp. NPDC048291 TaxID=3365530 RepID=UPI0037119A55
MGNVFGLVFLALIPALFGGLSIHSYRKRRAARHLKASGVETEALCTSLSWHEDNVSVHFTYTLPDGTEHSADSLPVRRLSVTRGDTVKIVYAPDSPATAELASLLDSSLRFHGIALAFLAPLTVVFTVWFVASAVAAAVA